MPRPREPGSLFRYFNDRQRWADILWRSDARPGQWREAGDRSPCQQPGREQPSALPTTRAGDGPIPANGDVTKIRLRPRQCRQPLFSRTTSRQSSGIQASPFGRPGLVADARRLTVPSKTFLRRVRRVAVRLTAPSVSTFPERMASDVVLTSGPASTCEQIKVCRPTLSIAAADLVVNFRLTSS